MQFSKCFNCWFSHQSGRHPFYGRFPALIVPLKYSSKSNMKNMNISKRENWNDHFANFGLELSSNFLHHLILHLKWQVKLLRLSQYLSCNSLSSLIRQTTDRINELYPKEYSSRFWHSICVSSIWCFLITI